MNDAHLRAKLVPEQALCRENVSCRPALHALHTPPNTAVLSKLPCFLAQAPTFVVLIVCCSTFGNQFLFQKDFSSKIFL